MVTIITTALIETLVKHMFTKALNEMDTVSIDSAPSWYMKPVNDDICSFSSANGRVSSINTAKNQAMNQMDTKINNIIDITIHDNIKSATTNKEQQLLDQWKFDPNLDMFIMKNLNYNKIVYEEEIDTSFVRACIPKKDILSYQKERLEIIGKSLLNYKADSAMNELDELLEKNN